MTKKHKKEMDRILTPTEATLLRFLRPYGARSLRQVWAQVGQEMNWFRLLDAGVVTKRAHAHGVTLSLTPDAACRLGHNSYLIHGAYAPRSPSTAYTLAAFAEAIDLMATRGYTIHDIEYQRAGDGLTDREREARVAHGETVRRSAPTRAITRVVLQVPDALDRQIEAIMPDNLSHRKANDARALQHPMIKDSRLIGRPMLYIAPPSQSESTRTVKKWIKEHQFSAGSWRHPLLIGVPDPERYRALLRKDAVAAQRSRQSSLEEAKPQFQYKVAADLRIWDRRNFRLIHLPTDQSKPADLVE